MKILKHKGGAEAGLEAQLLFYPVTEQLFVLNDSKVHSLPAVKKKLKKVLTYVVINTIYILNQFQPKEKDYEKDLFCIWC